MPVDRRTTESDKGKKKGNLDEDDQQHIDATRLSKDKMDEDANNASSLRPQSLAQSQSVLHESGMLIDLDKLLNEEALKQGKGD